MPSRRWKISREVGLASAIAGLTFLFSILQTYAVYYRVPADIATVASDVKELQHYTGDIRERLARVEEGLKYDRRRAEISN